MTQAADNSKVQGEGDYEAARRYDKAAHEFAESGKVEEAARDARPKTPEEAEALSRAERAGKAHSKGEDSAVGTAGTPPTP